MQQWRALLTSVVLIAPMHESNKSGIETEPLLREAIFISRRPILVSDLFQHALIDQQLQALSQHTARNAEARLKVLKTAHAEKCVAEHKQCPTVADHGERARKRASLAVEVIPTHAHTLPLTQFPFKTY